MLFLICSLPDPRISVVAELVPLGQGAGAFEGDRPVTGAVDLIYGAHHRGYLGVADLHYLLEVGPDKGGDPGDGRETPILFPP